MKKFKVLVFSKNRALQLCAYLESLIFYGNIKEEDIIVQYAHDDSYNTLLDQFKNIKWIKESTYDETLRSIVTSFEDDDLILFGCDDVVYFRRFSVDRIREVMKDRENACFSLRLGVNIDGAAWGKSNEDIVKWRWSGRPSHHGYPFELMGSVYRAYLVKQIVNHSQDPFRVPNDLEGRGHHWFINNRWVCGEYMVMANSNAACAAQDINRVQDCAKNRIQGTMDHTAEKLQEAFISGRRIDWPSMKGLTSSDCFLGYKYFKLK